MNNENVYLWNELRMNPFIYPLSRPMFLDGEIKTINGYLKTDKSSTKGTFRDPPKQLKVLFDKTYIKAWIKNYADKLGIDEQTFIDKLQEILNITED